MRGIGWRTQAGRAVRLLERSRFEREQICRFDLDGRISGIKKGL